MKAGDPSNGTSLGVVPLSDPIPSSSFDHTHYLKHEGQASELLSTSTSDEDYVPLSMRKRKKATGPTKPVLVRSKRSITSPQRPELRTDFQLNIAASTSAGGLPSSRRRVPYFSANGVMNVGETANVAVPHMPEPSHLSFGRQHAPWPHYGTNSLNNAVATLNPPPTAKSAEEFRDTILDAVRRMRLNCDEAEFKAGLLPRIEHLGPQTERTIFRRVAEREYEYVLQTLDGAVCDYRNAVKAAFDPFLQYVAEEEWIRLALLGLEDPIRKDYRAVLSDIKNEVDKIELNVTCLALSYQAAFKGGRTRDDLQKFCIGLLETAYSSIYEIKKFTVELDLSVMNELWV